MKKTGRRQARHQDPGPTISTPIQPATGPSVCQSENRSEADNVCFTFFLSATHPVGRLAENPDLESLGPGTNRTLACRPSPISMTWCIFVTNQQRDPDGSGEKRAVIATPMPCGRDQTSWAWQDRHLKAMMLPATCQH